MDELALLRDFRLEDAAANGAREHARAALAAAVARERRVRRRMVVALAFVVAAVVAGAAYAIVHELIVGAPAPQEVREQPAHFGHSAELIPIPHPDDPRLERARVAAVLDSSVGTVYLFSSPNARGVCGSAWIEGDRGYQGRLNLSTVCGERKDTFWAFGQQSFHGRIVHLFWGRAGDGIARISVRYPQRTVRVPIIGRWFLAELPGRPAGFTSYRADGRAVENRRFEFPQLTPHPRSASQPHQVTKAREVARLRVAGGGEEVTLFVAKASNGGYCQIVRSNRRPSNRGCGMPQPAAREIAVAAMSFGGAPRRRAAPRRPGRRRRLHPSGPLRRRAARECPAPPGLGALRGQARRLREGPPAGSPHRSETRRAGGSPPSGCPGHRNPDGAQLATRPAGAPRVSGRV